MNLQEIFNWYRSFNPGVTYDGMNQRLNQLEKFFTSIKDHINFDTITCIETGASQNWKDGCTGVLLAKMSEKTGGSFHSVDINKDIVYKSSLMYGKLGLKNVFHSTSDSVEYLKSVKIVPNIVHLDSMDLNLKDPFPCAIHGWEEFCAIEDKMPINSLIIIDDNYFKGTWVEWKDNKKDTEWEKLNIEYPIVGKGAFIYHKLKEDQNKWVLVSKEEPGYNSKLVYKKINL